MAEIVLNSNLNSSLYMSSISGAGPNMAPYVYSMEKSGVNLYKDRNVVVNMPGAQFGGSTHCTIPSFGILRDAHLKVKFKYKTGATAGTPNVARNLYGVILKSATLKNSSKQIEKIHGHSLIYQTQQHRDRRRLEVGGASNLILGSTAAQAASIAAKTGLIGSAANTETEVEVFVPLLFSTFEHATGCRDGRTNGIDFRFVEQCTLEVEFNNDFVATIGGTLFALAEAPTITKCEAYFDYDVIAEKDLLPIQKNNYSLSEAQSLCNGNQIQHLTSITASGTDINATITLMDTVLASGMLVMLYKKRNKADATLLATDIAAGTSIPLDVTTAGLDTTTAAGAAKLVSVIQRPWQYHQHVKDETARHGADFVAINALEISTSGRTLFKAESLGELMYLSGRKNRGVNNVGKWASESLAIQGSNGLSENNIYYIPFAESQHTDSISGGNISLKSLNSIQIHVEAENCKTDSEYVLETITYFNQIVQVSGSSGRIVKSLDS